MVGIAGLLLRRYGPYAARIRRSPGAASGIEWTDGLSAGAASLRLGRRSERVSGLLRLVFPKARHLTPGYLAWHLCGQSRRQGGGFSAFAGDELVGHLAGMALTCADRRRGPARAATCSTAPSIRDTGGAVCMSRLSEAIFEEASARGFAFSISTGNRYSSKPLLTRYQQIGPLDARIGLGLPRLAPRSGAGPSFERIWSEEALRWRLANPEAATRSGGTADGASRSAQRRPAGHRRHPPPGPRQRGVSAFGRTAPGPLRSGSALDPGLDWALGLPAHSRCSCAPPRSTCSSAT